MCAKDNKRDSSFFLSLLSFLNIFFNQYIVHYNKWFLFKNIFFILIINKKNIDKMNTNNSKQIVENYQRGDGRVFINVYNDEKKLHCLNGQAI